MPMAGDIGDTDSTPGLGSSPGGGNGNPLHYSLLENPMDRGAWQATVLGVAKSQTRLKGLSTRACCFTLLSDKTLCPRKEPSYPISNPWFKHVHRMMVSFSWLFWPKRLGCLSWVLKYVSQTSRIGIIWGDLVKLQILGLHPRHMDAEIMGSGRAKKYVF